MLSKVLLAFFVSVMAAGCYSPRYVEVGGMSGLSTPNPRSIDGPTETTVSLIQGADHKFYLTILLNGHAFAAAVDSGASPSLFDRDSLARVGVSVRKTGDRTRAIGGGVEEFAGEIDLLTIGEFELHGLKCSAIDLTAARKQQRDLNFPDIEVLLGADFLALFRAKLDFEGRTLTLKMPNYSPEPTPSAVH